MIRIRENICRNLCTQYKKSRSFKFDIKRLLTTGTNSFESGVEDVDMINIETHWRDKIHVKQFDPLDTRKKKFYCLPMFPYPSGKLHMGHIRVYTISDSTAHYYRLKGYNVLHPMGWDAFGLPAENAAIERKVDPAKWTKDNIQQMKNQLQQMNYFFDWDREFSTCDPEYYKWTQDLFLKLYDKDLVYQKESHVNWDPVDKTVLAEEQVNEHNISWRSGAKVEKKVLKQWYIRTSAFSKNLVENLNSPSLKNWDEVKKIQKNWLGVCTGTTLTFQVISNIPNCPKSIDLWTDHPEFIEYTKFIAISPQNLMNNSAYCSEIIPEIQILDAKVLNPFNGEEIPIYVTEEIKFPPFRDNYLGIPAISMDDYEFLEKVGLTFTRHKIRTEEERLAKLEEVLQKAKKWKIGGYPTSSQTKDWLISRQRYWGTPIPLIYCVQCGVQPVPRDQLPVMLPKIVYDDSKTISTLRNNTEWLNTTCPKCGGSAERETDTMDTFVDSSWYFIRFMDPHNKQELCSTNVAKKLYPVDLYIGGKEHATMHLYYARFISHFLYSEGLLPQMEPFTQLLTQGMVKGLTHKVIETGQYIPEDNTVTKGNDVYEKGTQKKVITDWEKMSKSKHNGVNPVSFIEHYGIDTIRLLILGSVSPMADYLWKIDNRLKGIKNWQTRMWTITKTFRDLRNGVTFEELENKPEDKKFTDLDNYMFDSRNFFLKAISYNIVESQNFNTVISRMQGMTNSLYKANEECILKSIQFERLLASHIIALAPMAPHLSSELWSGYCSAKHHLVSKDEIDIEKGVFEQQWPKIDLDYKMRLSVLINGQQHKEKFSFTKRQLQVLTKEDAMQLLQTNPKITKKWDLTNADVTLYNKEDFDSILRVKCKLIENTRTESEI